MQDTILVDHNYNSFAMNRNAYSIPLGRSNVLFFTFSVGKARLVTLKAFEEKGNILEKETPT